MRGSRSLRIPTPSYRLSAVFATACLALLALAPACLASSTTRSGDEVTLTAAPGEENNVTSSAQTSDASPQPQFFVTDQANRAYQETTPPANTPAGPGCQAENGLRGALCGPFPVTVFTASLGDLDDL